MNKYITPPPQHPDKGTFLYRPDIDGLRCLAVVLVVVFHAFPNFMPGGFIGVDIFFVISGYLISSIIFQSRDAGTFSYYDFYARRIRRIFPALIVVLLACLAAGWWIMMANDYARLGRHTSAGAAFVSNLAFWSDSNYFDVASKTKPLLHLWSLGIEEQFYIIWPVLIALGWRLGRVAVLLSAAVFFSFVLCLWLTQADPTQAYYSPISRLWELGAGSLLAWQMRYRAMAMTARRANILSACGVALIAVALVVTDAFSSFPGWRAFLPVAGACMLIAAGPDAVVNRRIFSLKGMVWIGLISYPLYLWHWPLLSFSFVLERADKLDRTLRIILVVASFLLAWLTYRFFEKPVRHAQNRRCAVRALCAAMMALFLIGGAVFLQKGFEGRSINRDPVNVFLHEYRQFFKGQHADIYREICNFYDWRDGSQKASIDESCLRSGEKGTYFLWGDSHAQALYPGIQSILPEGVALAQVTASGCRPALRVVPRNGANIDACTYANAYAVEKIKELKPSVLIVTQAALHDRTDWDEFARIVKSYGGRIILVGPVPRWSPSLPEIYVRQPVHTDKTYIAEGLKKDLFAMDEKMATLYPDHRAKETGIQYVSILKNFCNEKGCLASVPGAEKYALFAVDGAHLSPAASNLVARQLLSRHF